MKDQKKYPSPQSFEGRIPLRQAIPLGLQHVLAMFVGNLTPLLIICGACGISSDDPQLLTSLLQNAMLVAGIVTLALAAVRFRSSWAPVRVSWVSLIAS